MSDTRRWIVTFGAACSLCLLFLPGCSGDGSDGGAGCTHAALPGGGPGDTGHFFPVDEGRTWTYSVYSSDFAPGQGTQTVTVGAPTTVQGEPAYPFTSSWTLGADSGTATDGYAVRAAGVYRVSSTEAGDPLADALPILVLPFPVQVTGPVQTVSCRHLQVVEQGVTFDVDVTVSVAITLTGASTALPAGVFSDVAVVRTVVDMTLRAQGETVHASVTITDGYAPDVGLVSEYATTTIEGAEVGLDNLELTAYAPQAAANAPASVRARGVERDGSGPLPESPEAWIQRVARRIARDRG